MRPEEQINKEQGQELAEACERLSANQDFKKYIEFEKTLKRNLLAQLTTPQFTQLNPAMHTAFLQGQIKTFTVLEQYREDLPKMNKHRSPK